jgi:hypothetical protein
MFFKKKKKKKKKKKGRTLGAQILREKGVIKNVKFSF